MFAILFSVTSCNSSHSRYECDNVLKSAKGRSIHELRYCAKRKEKVTEEEAPPSRETSTLIVEEGEEGDGDAREKNANFPRRNQLGRVKGRHKPEKNPYKPSAAGSGDAGGDEGDGLHVELMIE